MAHGVVGSTVTEEIMASRSTPFGIQSRVLSLSSRHDDMPVVLDGVVRSPRKEPGDQRPLVPVNPVGGEEPLFLLLCKRPFVDSWVQLVKPSQSAALTYNHN